MSKFDEVLNIARKKEKTTIAIASAHDKNVLTAVKNAMHEDIADFLLVGDERLIKEIAADISLDLTKVECINEVDDEKAAKIAAFSIRDGKANALMKGLTETSTIMRAVLNKEANLRNARKLNLLAVFELKNHDKLILLSDPAINIKPDFDTLKDIIENSIDAAEKIGIRKAKVAIISAKENVDEKMPSTVLAREVQNYYEKNNYKGAVIEGPLSLDIALSRESAKIKKVNTEVAGNADIIIFTNIEAANTLYKSLTMFANPRMGGTVLGSKAPVILTSRSDSSDVKLVSIALAAVFS